MSPDVNVSALTEKALSTSGVLWVGASGHERATWFATGPADGPLAGQVLLVSGGIEPDLGELAEGTRLVLRSKGDGGRLLTLRVQARRLDPGDPGESGDPGDSEWQVAADALRAERLNAPTDVVATWRAGSTLWALLPFGTPEQAPGTPGPDPQGRVGGPVGASDATTPVRRPWHLGGRGRRRPVRGGRPPT